MFRLKILVMAINSTGSTNLLAKYGAAQTKTVTPNPAAQTSASAVVPRTSQEDLIVKQKRLIQLQNDEINTLKSQQKSSSANPLATILSIVGGITLLNFLFNYKSPRRIQAEMQQAAGQMQEAVEASVRRAVQIMNEADGDLVVKPKEKPKRIVNAIFDSMGKVIGKKIIDNENDRLLKVIEYYPGTKKPATIESYDYTKGQINYNWFRENGTKAMEEIFDLKTRKKITTLFYKEDGKTLSKIKNA